MSLKSSVNTSIIKSDLRRYWYMSALFALMIFLTSVMFVISGPYYKDANDVLSFVQTEFARTMSLSLISICIFCVLISAVIFSYMHHKSAVSLMHSLPSKRGGLFVSHLISCAILITAAFLINAAILLSMKGSVDFYYRVSDVFMWLGVSFVYCFVISGISIICTMITGSFIASVIAPYVLASVIPLCEMIFAYVCQVYLYGFDTNNPFVISPKIYMDYKAVLDGGIILYLSLGIVCLVGALICYKKRHLENHTMVVSFKKLNPVFLYGVSIAAGFCGFMYIGEVTDIESLWFALPFGAAGVIIARMIIQKTFKPNGFIKPIAIYAVFICVIYALSGLDITGYENRIPDIDDIESVNVVGTYTQLGSTYIDGVEVLADNDKIHNPEVFGDDIKTVVALHKAIVENKKKLESKTVFTNTNYTYQPIEYTLKNGKTLKRSYRLVTDDKLLYERFGEVMEIESVKADRFSILSDAPKHFDGAQINIYGRDVKYVTNDDLTKLLAAMRKDIIDAKYEDYDGRDSAITVMVNYRIPTRTKALEKIDDTKFWWARQETYNIHNSYKNTIMLLSEWGINGSMDVLDEISSVSVGKLLEEEDIDEIIKHMPVSEKDWLVTYNDRQKIEEIMAYIDNNIENNINSSEGKRYEFHIVFNDKGTMTLHIVSQTAPPGI